MKDEQLHTLFKYRSLDGEFGRPAVERALLGSQLYWQRPSSFNDPFDCQPFFVFGSTDKERAKYARDLANRKMAGEPRRERLMNAKRMRATTQERAREIVRGVIDRTIVTCFAEENDNPLMWSHYASNHSGICLVFEETLDPVFLTFAVEYSAERPVVDMIKISRSRGSILSKIMHTKADCWSYERERRMFMRGEPGFVMFPGKCLTGLILGARISADDREYVTGLIEQRRLPTSLFQAQLDPRHYRVNILPLA